MFGTAQSGGEDATEIQDIRALGMGWAWFVNDLRVFLPAWQNMDLAHPAPDEPVSQIDADVPLEPIPVEGEVAEMVFVFHPYERPLAASPLVHKKRSLIGMTRMLCHPLLSLYRLILTHGFEMT